MDFIKNRSLLLCVIIFAVGLVLTALELVAYGTTVGISSNLAIMAILNFILFIGIIIACIYKNIRVLKILVITLLAWDGVAYLTAVIPMMFDMLILEGEILFTIGNIAILASLILVVLAAIVYVLGLLLNKNLNKTVIILYLIAAATAFVAFVLYTIFVCLGNASMWGLAVETLLKICVYAGTAIGIYIFNKKERSLQEKA